MEEKLKYATELLKKLSENDLQKSISFMEDILNDSCKKTNTQKNSSDKITIYTDGGCHKNKAGGWAAVLIFGDKMKKISGGEKPTTNNRMELLATINALESLKNATYKIEIFTDSQYVKNGITSWILNWKKKGWKTSQKTDVLNRDLWERLDFLNEKFCPEWNWVKGHAGIEYNEICDKLCQEEIAKLN